MYHQIKSNQSLENILLVSKNINSIGFKIQYWICKREYGKAKPTYLDHLPRPQSKKNSFSDIPTKCIEAGTFGILYLIKNHSRNGNRESDKIPFSKSVWKHDQLD